MSQVRGFKLTISLTLSLNLRNVLPAGLTITHLKANAYKDGEENNLRATADYEVPNGQGFLPGGVGSTAKISNVPVKFTDGTLGSLDVLGAKLSTKNIIDAT